MNLQMIGIDHTTAPVEIREKFSFTTKMQIQIMQELTARPDIRGALMLSTCNRTELWVHCRAGACPPLVQYLCAAAGADPAQYRERFLRRTGEAAAAYLFHMSSGLQSQIFGEDQILTQVKEALDRARAALCTDAVLEVLFRMAVTAAKKVKTGMQISTANTGAVGSCMSLLRSEGYVFSGKKCLVIGNGKMGKLAAQALRDAGCDVTVTVRQYRSGIVEIPPGCARIDYGRRMELLPSCNLVLSATTSPNVTLKYEDMLRTAWKQGLVLVDLAVPRDIDPQIGTLAGIRLFDIDSFHAPQSTELAQVRAWAEEVLSEQIQAFITWYDCRDMIPCANELAGKFGRDAAARMERTLQELPLAAGDADALRRRIGDAAEKQFRRLLFAVRDEAGASAFRQCLDAIGKLYE